MHFINYSIVVNSRVVTILLPLHFVVMLLLLSSAPPPPRYSSRSDASFMYVWLLVAHTLLYLMD